MVLNLRSCRNFMEKHVVLKRMIELGARDPEIAAHGDDVMQVSHSPKRVARLSLNEHAQGTKAALLCSIVVNRRVCLTVLESWKHTLQQDFPDWNMRYYKLVRSWGRSGRLVSPLLVKSLHVMAMGRVSVGVRDGRRLCSPCLEFDNIHQGGLLPLCTIDRTDLPCPCPISRLSVDPLKGGRLNLEHVAE